MFGLRCRLSVLIGRLSPYRLESRSILTHTGQRPLAQSGTSFPQLLQRSAIVIGLIAVRRRTARSCRPRVPSGPGFGEFYASTAFQSPQGAGVIPDVGPTLSHCPLVAPSVERIPFEKGIEAHQVHMTYPNRI